MDNPECVAVVGSAEATTGSLAGAGDASLENVHGADLRMEEGDEETECHPFVRVVQCDLVVKKLATMINFEDMKALSTVSRGCLQAVRRTDAFSKRARLIIGKEAVKSEILKESTYLWKNISLDLCLPVEVVELIDDILETVTSLSLTMQSPDTKDDKGMVHYLTEIFKRTVNLQTLEMEASIFNYVLHDVFSDVGLQTIMTNLQHLAIQSRCNQPKSVCYINGAEDDDSDTPFERNFFQLSMVPLQLKQFMFGKVLTISGSDSNHVKFVPKIVAATKDTLEDLELHFNVWKFEEMEVIRCPRLKRLALSANGNDKDPKIVKTFLKNQPLLETLEIDMHNQFPLGILMVLKGVVSKMKKLHLKAKKFSDTTVPVNWRFLEGMTVLKDFRIRKPSAGVQQSSELYGYGSEILEKLPVGTEKISVQGFESSFWRDQYPVTGNIGVLLSRFNNLTEINLLRSDNAVTDEGLQSIIATCTKLTCLTFSHCPEVTDFGISGIRKSEDGTLEEKVGLSLNELKGLLRLKIRSCPNVSSDCLLNVVKFDFLRYFDYYRNVQLPKEFLFQIARQNPCLEEVSLHITSYDNDDEYVRDLKNKVKEINPRLHLMEILEQSNWEDEDTDSDASSLIDEDGDSDFSGGGYHHDYDDYDDYDDSPDFFDVDEDEDIDDFF